MLETPLLTMRGISKSFPGVQALLGVHLELHPGQVLAVVGENGAGKSTLIKILGGAHSPDTGTMSLRGQPVQFKNPGEAQRAGLAVIYQEFNLIPELSARENIFLGRERTTFGWIQRGQEQQQARALFERLRVAIDTETRCSRLPVAHQQAVEIARALSVQAQLVVMDEPTASLTPPEVEALFNVIRDLKNHGIGILYVSHRLEEIFAIADHVLVLRDGEVVASGPISQFSRSQLIEKMVGRKLESEFPRRQVAIGEPRLVVKNLSRGNKVKDVSFEIRRGEIVALTGLVGAGRTEIARLIFGADRADGGVIYLDGRPLRIQQPRDAIKAGICLITEDRKNQGLILEHSVLDNFGLPNLPRFTTAGFVHQRQERDALLHYVQQLGIKIPFVGQLAKFLSGGNQQKVVLAKWLQANAEVILFDEPTRGIDVGAKHGIYLLMNELAAQGKAILMISSELPEVLGMADRILVLHEGRITGTLPSTATQEQIMELAVK